MYIHFTEGNRTHSKKGGFFATFGRAIKHAAKGEAFVIEADNHKVTPKKDLDWKKICKENKERLAKKSKEDAVTIIVATTNETKDVEDAEYVEVTE